MHTGAKVGCPGSLGSKETCDWTSRSDWFREIRTRTFVFKCYLYKGVTQASDATWKESSISGSGHLQDSRLDTEPGEWVDTVPKNGALWGGRTKWFHPLLSQACPAFSQDFPFALGFSPSVLIGNDHCYPPPSGEPQLGLCPATPTAEMAQNRIIAQMKHR